MGSRNERDAQSERVPRAGRYPLWVRDAEQRYRWDCCEAVARLIFGEDGEAAVVMAAGVLYRSDIPTR